MVDPVREVMLLAVASGRSCLATAQARSHLAPCRVVSLTGGKIPAVFVFVWVRQIASSELHHSEEDDCVKHTCALREPEGPKNFVITNVRQPSRCRMHDAECDDAWERSVACGSRGLLFT